jgi:GDP/UDP-N,N'-diacetylbacillosamine 2-epimerase (hydrolysing)
VSLRIAVVTGTRADFGLWTPVLEEFAARGPDVADAGLVAMAMHLDERFGSTIDEVRRSGTPIWAEVASIPEEDTAAAMAGSLGTALAGVAPALERTNPDWLLVLGDRGEQLAAALAAVHLGVAIAHVHGGERTHGAVDDTLRDLITRCAHLHLVATEGARRRLATLGEDPWRIVVAGAPGLDAIRASHPRPPAAALRARYGLGPDAPYLLAIVHPETAAGSAPPSDLADAVLEAAVDSGLPVVAVWPNADAGGRAIARTLEHLRPRLAALVPSVPHADFLSLLAGAAALLGNSSSGIIEAPFLAVPAVNVGDRQRGRERGDNVIDATVDRASVGAALERALDPAFRTGLAGRSPYGDGHAARRIVEAILATPVDARLLRKDVP